MRKVVSLHLPMWSIERARRRQGAHRPLHASQHRQASSSEPVILLIAHQRGQQVVRRCCEKAQAVGVREGMKLSHARALLSPNDEACVLPHEPQHDATALETLARWAQRFTPQVAADPPDGLLLEMTGCERLYGSDGSMIERIVRSVQRLGLTVRAALAPSVGCAWALARFGKEPVTQVSEIQIEDVLAPLPVRALRIEPTIEAALHEVAIDRIGELWRLPREALATRFGTEVLHRLDQALGHVFEGVATAPVEAPVRVERAFAGPVIQFEAIAMAVRELLDDLSAELARREQGARRLVLDIERLDGALRPESARQRLTLCEPNRDVKHLWALLRPHVERLNLGRGVERVILTASHTAPLLHAQSTWIDSDVHLAHRDADKHVGELVDILTSRLGPERVLRAQLVETHVPERTCRHRPASQRMHSPNAGLQGEPRAHVVLADRPSLLLDCPRPVAVTLLAPDGPVVQMRDRERALAVRTSIGPERITPRWWLVGSEAHKPPPRDYFKVQDEAGRWWWLYHKLGTSEWFVHGQWV